MTRNRETEFGQPIGNPLETTLPCATPSRKPMQGHYCRLVPTDLSHAAGLFAAFGAACDTADWTYLPYGPFENAEAFSAWLSTACLGDDPQFFTILDTEGTPVGRASYLRIKPETGVIKAVIEMPS